MVEKVGVDHMRFDVGLPLQSTDRSRDETFIVFFEGFIKNPSEGMIRTMLRDKDDWIFLYPDLQDFIGMTMDEIYENTMLFQPDETLKILSDGKRTDEEIANDLEKIMPKVILENSKMTSFEFALFNILKAPHIKKCYIYKEGTIYRNEIGYVRRRFSEVFNKIEFVDEEPFTDLFDRSNATTIFLTDPAFVFDYIENQIPEEKSSNVMFIILNSHQTVEMTDQGAFQYTSNFEDKLEETNETKEYGVSAMFNFPISEYEEGDETENE